MFNMEITLHEPEPLYSILVKSFIQTLSEKQKIFLQQDIELWHGWKWMKP